MSESDRRSTKRLPYFAEAEVDGLDAGHRLQVRLADISSGGAFVDARTVLPAGTKTKLKFTLMGLEVNVLAEVRYSMPSFGMGVRFLAMSPQDRAVLDEFIRQQQ